MDTATILTLISLFIFLLGSAISSSMETAFTSVNRIKVKQKAEGGDKKAQLIEQMLEQPSSFLGTALFLNNLFNIGSASMATALALRLHAPYPEALATGIMTFFILIFGEITPKTFAVQSADRLAFFLAPLMNFLQKILRPIVRSLILISNSVLKLFGAQTRKEGPFITEEEIMTLVSVGEEEGIIKKQEKELINSIFEFGDTIVKEVMIPRMDMLAADKKADLDTVFQLILKEGVSRVPVYDETIDNVVGIVYARDLLIVSAKHKNCPKTIQTLVKPAYYVPETKRVIELLTELQKAKVHMAIVVDEYGGTAGLVTIEDLLEEIVGEIFDEYDSEEVLIEKIDKENFRVNAKTDLDEINKQLNLDLPDAEYESIGGFVVNLFGKIPMPGEQVDYDSAVFTVEKVIKRRLSKILITKKEAVINKDEQ